MLESSLSVALNDIDSVKSTEEEIRDRVMNDIHTSKIPLTAVGDIPIKYLDVSNLPHTRSDNIMTPSKAYKPFRYEFGYKMWKAQNDVMWMPEPVPMGDDVRDWKVRLTPQEKSLLTKVFPLFVQSDVLVNNAYLDQYAKIFKPHEIRMGISSIANIESVHTAAYAHLLDSLAFPERTYSEFLEFKEMIDKHDFTAGFKMDTLTGIALAMFVFGCLTEGVQLFGTFSLLMDFPRRGKMKGMGQIVSWSVRDESMHCVFVGQIYQTFLREFGHLIDIPRLREAEKRATATVVNNEFGFTDLAFRDGEIPSLSKKDHYLFIEAITDMRLKSFGRPPMYGEKDHKYDWFDALTGGIEHANFFEQKGSDYQRNATKGTWDDAWAVYDVV